MGSKKFKNKTCVYCGKENASSTGDHVFAREFFLEGQRANLPQVPACQSCNNKKSELEHYLTTVLPFGGQHADSGENLSLMVPKRLNKNRPLHEKLRFEMKRGWFETASGLVIESTVIPIDFRRLEMLLIYIVRGLCWEHLCVQLMNDDFVKVLALTKVGEKYFDDHFFKAKVKNRIEKTLGNGTIYYEGVQDIDNPKVTAWRIKWYGGIQFAGDNNYPNMRTSIFGAVTANKHDIKDMARSYLDQISIAIR